jgi:hypothetical protein
MQKSAKLSGQPIISQLLSYIPRILVDEVVAETDSDKYYKKMKTYNQLVFMLYGIVGKVNSLNSICKNLIFLENKLTYLNIKELPASSTLSDANINRKSEVFKKLYFKLLDYYKPQLNKGFVCSAINNEAPSDKVKRFDSSTFTLFTDIFKGAGRNPIDGTKKGGIKAQTVLPFNSPVPDFINLGAAAKNDKNFLGQLIPIPGYLYIFDKGYVNYNVFNKWTELGVFFVTRLNENAVFNVIENIKVDIIDIANGIGILKEQIIEIHLSETKSVTKLRLITYKDPYSGKVLRFLTNQFEYKSSTIAQLYKNRWAIEVFFKQLKQNFQLTKFYSDSEEGIQTQIWLALIANLIFTVIYQQVKETEQFITIVGMARANMGSYICLITILQKKKLSQDERKIEIVQLELFSNVRGGVFENMEKCP